MVAMDTRSLLKNFREHDLSTENIRSGQIRSAVPLNEPILTMRSY